MESTLRHLARLILPPEFITYGQLPSSSNSVENAPLLQVLFGLRQPTLIPKEETEPLQWFDETLNESQKRAVEFVLGMEEVGCIHGPPGVSLQVPLSMCCIRTRGDDTIRCDREADISLGMMLVCYGRM
jgi:hypothetical protein